MKHGLSFDIECYYQIVAKDYLGAQLEPTPEVEVTTGWLLDMLAERGVKATFFTLGNVARRYPALVRRMVSEGHELALHGDQHLYLTDLTPETFKAEISRAIDSLEQAAGTRVRGHRAPAFSIVNTTLWATNVLREFGFDYDSSIYPIAGARYGIASAPKTIHRLENGLTELPMTAIALGGRDRPAAGGGYFRMFPYAWTRWAMKQCEREQRPAITYFHPHEFSLVKPHWPPPGDWLSAQDFGRQCQPLPQPVSQPKGAKALRKFNFLQAIGRGRSMRRKLIRLLGEFEFVPLRDLLPSQTPSHKLS